MSAMDNMDYAAAIRKIIDQNNHPLTVHLPDGTRAPAIISGYNCAFARVTFPLHGVPVTYEYAWPAVNRAIRNGTALRI